MNRFWTKKERKPLDQKDLEKLTTDNEKKKFQDIIITKKIKKITYKDGAKIEKFEKELTNLTRFVNESAKVLKQQTAQKIKELREIFTSKE